MIAEEEEDFKRALSEEWISEGTIKQLRRKRFECPKTLYGKRRRHLCLCSLCRGVLQATDVQRFDSADAPLQSLVMTNRKMSAGAAFFTITNFDLEHPGCLSINKNKGWTNLLADLSDCADATYLKHDYYRRKVLVFDMEVQSVLIDNRRQIVMQTEAEKRSEYARAQLKPVYYECIVPYWATLKAEDVHSMVKPLHYPVEVTLGPKEEYVVYSATFKSRRTAQEPYTDIRGPMIRINDIKRELNDARSRPPFTSAYTRRLYSGNNMRCWASTAAPGTDYEDWNMEIDLGARHLGGKFVRAVVLQGRLPCVQTFPHPRSFDTEASYKKFDGPFYPVVANEHPLEMQWVEKFEITARCTRGSWFSLGIFQGNTNRWDQVRIDLPMIDSMRVKFLRIRPLSKDKGGFHGPAPAFRIGVVVLKQSAHGRVSKEGNEALDYIDTGGSAPQQVPKGFVRYEVTLPREVTYVDEQDKTHLHSRRSPYLLDESRSMATSPYRWSSREYAKIRPSAKVLLQCALRDLD